MNRSIPEADFLRLAQVAALLNVSPTEVRRYRDRGELRCCWLGSKVLIPRAEYERLRDRLNTEAGLPPVRVLAERGRPRGQRQGVS